MQAFREAVESGDPVAMAAVLADDVMFSSPAVFKPYQGKEATMTILSAVVTVFEDFRYTQVVEQGADSVLVFEARVGEKALQGADFVHVNDEGLIDRLTVMVRPFSGLTALLEAMGKALSPQ